MLACCLDCDCSPNMRIAVIIMQEMGGSGSCMVQAYQLGCKSWERRLMSTECLMWPASSRHRLMTGVTYPFLCTDSCSYSTEPSDDRRQTTDDR